MVNSSASRLNAMYRGDDEACSRSTAGRFFFFTVEVAVNCCSTLRAFSLCNMELLGY